MKNSRSLALGLSLLLAACGKPDASGIYVATTDSRVTLVQLVQAQDGKLTGRLEETIIGVDGTITTKEAMVDGSVSGNELMLRPASAWFGGIQASGTISGNKLTLTNKNDTLTADRSSLQKYQEAVTKLKGDAGQRQTEVAETKAQAAEYKARLDAAHELAEKKAKLVDLASKLNEYASKLDEGVSRSPNFSKLAKANTARIAQLVQRARGQSDMARSQLAVAANQIEVDTNQIDIARSQYADGLNEIVNAARDAAGSIGGICGSPPPTQLQSACGEANATTNSFKGAIGRATKNFSPHKQQVQAEIDKQSTLSQQVDG